MSDEEESYDSTQRAIIWDNGSESIKAGFAGCSSPRAYTPNLVGIPQHELMMVGVENRKVLVGDRAVCYKGVLSIERPIKNGVVQNWDHMEKVWHHVIYDELRVDPSEYNFLLTEPVLNPKKNREKMAELMFEKFCVKGMYVTNGGLLGTYASGRGHSTVCVQVGDTVTYTYPVAFGRVLEHSIQRIDLGGRDVTDNMMKMLNMRTREFTNSSDHLIAQKIKEELCYVSDDFGLEHYYSSPLCNPFTVPINDLIAQFCGISCPDKEYELPDGRKIEVGMERFLCPEILFNPQLIGREIPGVAELIYNTITSAPIDIRRDLRNQIVLCGGTPLMNNFEERLNSELGKLFNLSSSHPKIGCCRPPESKWMTWIGGSIMSSISDGFGGPKWVGKSQYEEYGPSVVHRLRGTSLANID